MARLLIGNIKGPKGDKGDTGSRGPQGDMGPQGMKGSDATSITVSGTNYDTHAGISALYTWIMVDGRKIDFTPGRGHTLAIVDPSNGKVESIKTYDTYTNPSLLQDPLSNAPDGRIICLFTGDASGLDSTTRELLTTCGSAMTDTWKSGRVTHLFIGMRGLSPGNAYECVHAGADGDRRITAWYTDTGIVLNGAMGPRGQQGIKGDQGAVGPIGPQGAIGPQGPEGIQGVKGDKGDKGDAGAIGATGPQGPMGQSGPQGPTGATGATGPQGKQGIQGAQGLQGSQGPSGPQGASGVTAPASGFFTLQVEPNGDLYAVYADTATASEAPVSYDPTTGNLYYTINDGK